MPLVKGPLVKGPLAKELKRGQEEAATPCGEGRSTSAAETTDGAECPSP